MGEKTIAGCHSDLDLSPCPKLLVYPHPFRGGQVLQLAAVSCCVDAAVSSPMLGMSAHSECKSLLLGEMLDSPVSRNSITSSVGSLKSLARAMQSPDKNNLGNGIG